jgi:hypothetical protein
MMTIKRIREYLTATPFRPIRVHLSDGSHHDIPHPEFAWSIGNRLYVARVVKGRGADDPAVEELAVLHITHIEPLTKPKAKK